MGGSRDSARVTVASQIDLSGRVSPANSCEISAPSHFPVSLEQETLPPLSVCEGSVQQGTASSHGGKRPWLQGASDQVPLDHITVRIQHGDLLTAHSTQTFPLAAGALQARRAIMAAGGRNCLTASLHRGEEGRTEGG